MVSVSFPRASPPSSCQVLFSGGSCGETGAAPEVLALGVPETEPQPRPLGLWRLRFSTSRVPGPAISPLCPVLSGVSRSIPSPYNTSRIRAATLGFELNRGSSVHALSGPEHDIPGDRDIYARPLLEIRQVVYQESIVPRLAREVVPITFSVDSHKVHSEELFKSEGQIVLSPQLYDASDYSVRIHCKLGGGKIKSSEHPSNKLVQGEPDPPL